MNESAIAILLFGFAATFCITQAIHNYVNLIKNKDRIIHTSATVIDTETVVPTSMKTQNSRWAYVRFRINGKEYTSSKRIQVPMNTSVGDRIEISCFKDNPSVVFTLNWKKAGAFLVIGILCIVIMVYLKNNS